MQWLGRDEGDLETLREQEVVVLDRIFGPDEIVHYADPAKGTMTGQVTGVRLECELMKLTDVQQELNTDPIGFM